MTKKRGKIVAPPPETTHHLGYHLGDTIKCKVRKVTYVGVITDIHLHPTPCISILDKETGQHRVARFEDITEVVERAPVEAPPEPLTDCATSPEAPEAP